MPLYLFMIWCHKQVKRHFSSHSPTIVTLRVLRDWWFILKICRKLFHNRIKAEWRIYATLILTTIGSDNDLSPGRHQATTWTNNGTFLLDPYKQTQWNFARNLKAFIQQNESENVVCEMVVILLRPQCVNSQKSFGEIMFDFAVSSVPANEPGLLGAGTSTSIMLTNWPSCVGAGAAM